MRCEGNQIPDIAVSAGNVIDDFAKLITFCIGQIVIGQLIIFTIQIRLNGAGGRIIHFLSAAVDQLNAVVVIDIMRSRNHDSAVKIVAMCDKCNAGRCRNMQHVGIPACRGEACNDCILKHIAGAARVLSDYNPCLFPDSCAIIPTDKLTDLICMITGEIDVCLTAKSVCSEIPSHIQSSSSGTSVSVDSGCQPVRYLLVTNAQWHGSHD